MVAALGGCHNGEKVAVIFDRGRPAQKVEEEIEESHGYSFASAQRAPTGILAKREPHVATRKTPVCERQGRVAGARKEHRVQSYNCATTRPAGAAGTIFRMCAAGRVGGGG